MLKKTLLLFALTLFPLVTLAEQLPVVNLNPPGYVDGVAAYCVKHDNSRQAIICSATDPLNVAIVAGSVSVGTVTNQATAAATPPTYLAGGQNESQTLSGGLRVQLNFGSTDLALGQTTKAGSLPVVIASDQGGITANLGTIGTAATAANQALQLTQETTAATAAGAPADAAYTGTGSTSIVGGIKGVYTAIVGTLTVGTHAVTQASGPWTTKPNASSSSADAITPVKSTTAETSHVLKASPGNLYSVYVTTGATAGYLLILNATSDPGNGAVTPVDCVEAPANQTSGVDVGGAPPDWYSTGVTAVFSTTGCFTETQSATAFFKGRAQ